MVERKVVALVEKMVWKRVVLKDGLSGLTKALQ